MLLTCEIGLNCFTHIHQLYIGLFSEKIVFKSFQKFSTLSNISGKDIYMREKGKTFSYIRWYKKKYQEVKVKKRKKSYRHKKKRTSMG